MSNRKYALLIFLALLIGLALYFFLSAPAKKSQKDSDGINSISETENPIQKVGKNENFDLEKYLKIEKNNSIREFLLRSDNSVYFLDLLVDTLRLKKRGTQYEYFSSIQIGRLDKSYVSGFVNRITPDLLEHQIDSLTITLMLPVDENGIPQPPPPPGDFYGNTLGGKIPGHLDNIYKY